MKGIPLSAKIVVIIGILLFAGFIVKVSWNRTHPIKWGVIKVEVTQSVYDERGQLHYVFGEPIVIKEGEEYWLEIGFKKVVNKGSFVKGYMYPNIECQWQAIER